MIGILTYNVPHRKTFDTLCLLKAKGFHDIVVFSQPLHYKKTYSPLYEHRPKCSNHLHPSDICKQFNYDYHFQTPIHEVLPLNSKVLVCGAGIIPQSVVENYRLINAHPGFLPEVRGLDALKWSIMKGKPIGVTTHRIGLEIDAGLMIDRKMVPIYINDTFHTVAQRQYELEIAMLVEAIEKIDHAHEYIGVDQSEVHKRMSKELEQSLFTKFEELKSKVLKLV